MVNIPDWAIWVGFSGFLAILALVWNAGRFIINWYRRPKLIIEMHNEWNGRWVGLDGRRFAKFHCLQIRNQGKNFARECTALLQVIEKPNSATNLENEHQLHWADIDYSFRTNESQPTDIFSGYRRLDVFFSQSSTPTILQPGVNISDVYCSGNLGTFRIDPTTGSITPYAPGGNATVQSSAGVTPPSFDSWIAIPIALSNPTNTNQANLPPGRYRIKIKVECENGDGDEKEFRITIAGNGQNNTLSII